MRPIPSSSAPAGLVRNLREVIVKVFYLGARSNAGETKRLGELKTSTSTGSREPGSV